MADIKELAIRALVTNRELARTDVSRGRALSRRPGAGAWRVRCCAAQQARARRWAWTMAPGG
jgi:hypothetical protein